QRLGRRLELLLERRDLQAGGLGARLELGLLARAIKDPLLELGILDLERLLRVLGLLELLGGVGDLFVSRRDLVVGLLELLVPGDDRLAQVHELFLATRTLTGGVRGGSCAIELGLELRDLTLELADFAQRAAIVHAGLVALGIAGDRV